MATPWPRHVKTTLAQASMGCGFQGTGLVPQGRAFHVPHICQGLSTDEATQRLGPAGTWEVLAHWFGSRDPAW